MGKKKSKEFNQSKFEKFINLKENFVISNYKNKLNKNGIFYISNAELKFEEIVRKKIEEYKQNNKNSKNSIEEISIDLKKAQKTFNSISYEKDPELNSLLSIYLSFKKQNTFSNHFNIRRNAIYEILNKEKNIIGNQEFLYNNDKIEIININNLNTFSTSLSKIVQSSSNLYFRGQSNLNWIVQPGIVRNSPNFESEYFNETLRHYPYEFENETTYCEKLAKMQHFGIPTRLLDITENPYIALFFACSSNFDDYGEVRIYTTDNKNIRNYNDKELDEEIKNLLLNNKTLTNKNCILLGKYSNKRIQNQKGLFIFCSDISKESSVEDLEYKTKENKKIVFVINKKVKKQILDELETLGITEEFVYPDIENSAVYLKNKFKRKSEQSKIKKELKNEN